MLQGMGRGEKLVEESYSSLPALPEPQCSEAPEDFNLNFEPEVLRAPRFSFPGRVGAVSVCKDSLLRELAGVLGSGWCMFLNLTEPHASALGFSPAGARTSGDLLTQRGGPGDLGTSPLGSGAPRSGFRILSWLGGGVPSNFILFFCHPCNEGEWGQRRMAGMDSDLPRKDRLGHCSPWEEPGVLCCLCVRLGEARGPDLAF